MELASHHLVRLGLAAFIIAGALFLVLVPTFLITALTVPGSVSLLLLLWIFVWVAMILASATARVARAPAVPVPPASAPAPQHPAHRPAKRRSRKR